MGKFVERQEKRNKIQELLAQIEKLEEKLADLTAKYEAGKEGEDKPVEAPIVENEEVKTEEVKTKEVKKNKKDKKDNV